MINAVILCGSLCITIVSGSREGEGYSPDETQRSQERNITRRGDNVFFLCIQYLVLLDFKCYFM